jgi:anti-sigma regulatory factor (Ser/Thr protein kinase)
MSRQLQTMERHGIGRAAPSSAGWPLRSRLELAAWPSAVPSVRLHAKLIVYEWGLGGIAESVELVVSELATNAVKVSAGSGGSAPASVARRLAPACIGLFLACDRGQVLVQIWDGDPARPQPADVEQDAESGRGLLLVHALAEDWGWYCPAGSSQGKWVWAVVAE